MAAHACLAVIDVILPLLPKGESQCQKEEGDGQVLIRKYERKPVPGEGLLLLNLGTPHSNFSGLTEAQPCLWLSGDPVKVRVPTVLSKAGLRLHISNKVFLGNAYAAGVVQGPHCVTRGGHTLRPLRPLRSHCGTTPAESQLIGLGCSQHWGFHLFL